MCSLKLYLSTYVYCLCDKSLQPNKKTKQNRLSLQQILLCLCSRDLSLDTILWQVHATGPLVWTRQGTCHWASLSLALFTLQVCADLSTEEIVVTLKLCTIYTVMWLCLPFTGHWCGPLLNLGCLKMIHFHLSCKWWNCINLKTFFHFIKKRINISLQFSLHRLQIQLFFAVLM